LKSGNAIMSAIIARMIAVASQPNWVHRKAHACLPVRNFVRSVCRSSRVEIGSQGDDSWTAVGRLEILAVRS
jgi:hypothetical protein